jgi:hypothetical protein
MVINGWIKLYMERFPYMVIYGWINHYLYNLQVAWLTYLKNFRFFRPKFELSLIFWA